MNNSDREYFRPFVISTYKSYFGLSLGKTLQIWSIVCITFSALLYQVTFKNRSSLPYLVYTSDTSIFFYYYLAVLSSSVLALLTSVFSSRKLAISCLSLTLASLVATTLMLGGLGNIFADKSSFGNSCVFESEFFRDWRLPLLVRCSASYSKICVSNEDYYSSHLIRNCGILVLEEESSCQDFQTRLVSAGEINQFVDICISHTSYKYQALTTTLAIYLHYSFMLVTIPIGVCILRVIYSIYCIVSVGGTGWEQLSAEELLLSPQVGLLNENPVIPYRYSLNGKNFLRI